MTVGVAGVAEAGERTGVQPRETAARGASHLGGTDVRVDAHSLDAVADNATQVRILSLAARNSIQRIYELAKLAEDGMREDQPKQILAVLGTMLRHLAVDVESSQRRLLRSAEDGLDTLLTLQLQPLRAYLLHLGRYARELARSLGRDVEVEIVGEETRLDRRIARELEDSLLHLVRNAVDHGIETARRPRSGGQDAGRQDPAGRRAGGGAGPPDHRRRRRRDRPGGGRQPGRARRHWSTRRGPIP